MLLNNQGVIEEIKEKIKSTWRQMKTKHNDSKSMGCSKSSSKGEVYSNTILPQETRNISNKQPNLTPKSNRERRTKKPSNKRKSRQMASKVNSTKHLEKS